MAVSAAGYPVYGYQLATTLTPTISGNITPASSLTLASNPIELPVSQFYADSGLVPETLIYSDSSTLPLLPPDAIIISNGPNTNSPAFLNLLTQSPTTVQNKIYDNVQVSFSDISNYTVGQADENAGTYSEPAIIDQVKICFSVGNEGANCSIRSTKPGDISALGYP
jgi:hypothetical protein